MVRGGLLMAKHLFKRMANGFIPADEDSIKAFSMIPLESIIYLNLPSPKSIVNDEETKRRAAQNALMWGWLHDLEKTKVNEFAGSLAEEWHDYFRRKYLFPIFVAADIEQQNWALTATALDSAFFAGAVYHEQMWKIILDSNGEMRLSTTAANVVQFSEYLNCIERFAHSRGVLLRTDPKTYQNAHQ